MPENKATIKNVNEARLVVERVKLADLESLVEEIEDELEELSNRIPNYEFDRRSYLTRIHNIQHTIKHLEAD